MNSTLKENEKILENLEDEKKSIVEELKKEKGKNFKEYAIKENLQIQLNSAENSLNNLNSSMERLHTQMTDSIVRLQLADELTLELREKCQEKDDEMRVIQQTLIESNVNNILGKLLYFRIVCTNASKHYMMKER